MSIATRVEVKDEKVLSALSRLSLQSDGRRALLDQIGASEADNTRLRFSDQAAPDGTPWEPSIRAKTQGGETLRDTGRLANSITHVTGDDSVEVGTNVMYAAMMHDGGTVQAVGGGYLKFRIGPAWIQKKSVTIPARPFLGLDSEGETEIIGIIDQFMRSKIE